MADQPLRIPVIQEVLRVGKRVREAGGVRIHKRVTTHEEPLAIPLLSEDVEVERVRRDQPVAVAPKLRFEGETLVIPVVEEVLVVEKRLVLREELRVTRRLRRRVEAREMTLRREEVVVEPLTIPEGAPEAKPEIKPETKPEAETAATEAKTETNP